MAAGCTARRLQADGAWKRRVEMIVMARVRAGGSESLKEYAEPEAESEG